MFCPKRGTQNPENATFCGACGTPLGNAPKAQPQQPATATQASSPLPAVPGAHADAAAVKGGVSNKAVLIGLIAVAAVVVIAVIVGVVTCSGGGGGKAPNLNGLVTDKAEQVAGTLEKLSKGKTQKGDTFFSANDEMRDLIKKLDKAFDNDKKDMKDLKESVQKTNPWAVIVVDDENKTLTANDVKDGEDPSMVSYDTFRVLEKPKSEDIAKIVSEVCNYDKIVIGYNDDGELFTGMARNNDEVIQITANEYEGVYEISVGCYRLDELKSSDAFEDSFDNLYDNYEDKNLEDIYRK